MYLGVKIVSNRFSARLLESSDANLHFINGDVFEAGITWKAE